MVGWRGFKDPLERPWAYPTQLTACIFKLLILTGARKGELISATWDQFDLEAGVWTKPAHLTKQKKKENLPLSTQTLEILEEMKSQATSSFVFPGKVDGKPLIPSDWQRLAHFLKVGRDIPEHLQT